MVTSAVPFHLMVALLTKPVPYTLRVKALPPAVTLVGASEVVTGGGLFTVKFFEPDVPPPGVGSEYCHRESAALGDIRRANGSRQLRRADIGGDAVGAIPLHP